MRGAFVFPISLLSACSLFVDTGNLDGDGASTPDAAGAPDATTANDGSQTNDASDAGDAAGDASLEPTCNSLIVDTFDVGALGAKWTAVTGAAALDTTDVVSAPNSLALTLTPNGGGGSAYLRKTFSKTKRFCCDLSFRSPILDGEQGHRIFKIAGDGQNYELRFTAGGATVDVYENHYSSIPAENFNRTTGKFTSTTAWRRMRVDANLPVGAGIGSVKVVVDGIQVINSDLGSAVSDLGFEELFLGSDFTQGTESRVLHYDDVQCATK